MNILLNKGQNADALVAVTMCTPVFPDSETKVESKPAICQTEPKLRSHT